MIGVSIVLGEGKHQGFPLLYINHDSALVNMNNIIVLSCTF